MRLNGKPVTYLTADDITALLGQSESQTVDFKLAGYSGSGWQNELAKDVIGMANQSGGVILIGIEEKNEEVIGWPGISLENGNKDPMEKYYRSLRERIEPPALGLVIREIKVHEDRYVIAIGVPASLSRPHRTKITGEGSGRGRWAIRRERDTVDMSYEEIRASFLGAAQIDRQAREFHRDRTAVIKADWRANSGYGAVMVMHITPIGFGNQQFNVASALELRRFFNPPGEPTGMAGLLADFDGIVRRITMGAEDEWTGWVKVYRYGTVEGVMGHYACLQGEPGDQHRRRVFNHFNFENNVRASTKSYIEGLLALGYNPPFAVSLSLLNGERAVIDTVGGRARQLDRAIMTMEPGLIEAVAPGQSYDAELRPLFDQLWNAFGIPRCLSYDDNGVWRGHPGVVNLHPQR